MITAICIAIVLLLGAGVWYTLMVLAEWEQSKEDEKRDQKREWMRHNIPSTGGPKGL